LSFEIIFDLFSAVKFHSTLQLLVLAVCWQKGCFDSVHPGCFDCAFCYEYCE